MRLAGLGHRFRLREGAFGGEQEKRWRLVELARQRAGRDYDLDQIWVIGDTHLDMRAAKLAGVQGAALTAGYGDQSELRIAGARILATTPQDTIEQIIALEAKRADQAGAASDSRGR